MLHPILGDFHHRLLRMAWRRNCTTWSSSQHIGMMCVCVCVNIEDIAVHTSIIGRQQSCRGYLLFFPILYPCQCVKLYRSLCHGYAILPMVVPWWYHCETPCSDHSSRRLAAVRCATFCCPCWPGSLQSDSPLRRCGRCNGGGRWWWGGECGGRLMGLFAGMFRLIVCLWLMQPFACGFSMKLFMVYWLFIDGLFMVNEVVWLCVIYG